MLILQVTLEIGIRVVNSVGCVVLVLLFKPDTVLLTIIDPFLSVLPSR